MARTTLDFLVVGAQKCGTTSLHRYLSSHPEIFLPPEKEIAFFYDEKKYARGLQWYLSSFFPPENEGKLVGEVSPQYMYSRTTAARILDALPEVKIIAVLRNPIDRAYSHYNMSRRRGLEALPFEEAVQRCIDAIRKGRDLSEHHNYLSFSLYAQILEAYFACFPRNQISVYYTEELAADPVAVMRSIFSFVGCDPSHIPPTVGRRYHASGEIRYPTADRVVRSRLVKAVARAVLSSRVRARLGFWFEQWNIREVPPPLLALAVRDQLREFFARDVARLRTLTGSTPPWREFTGTAGEEVSR